ncbi:WhiB family transcriptional regulator [Kitasatospora sp. NPDC089509]|uniref:WhiB family transcriptional regulator n=1 Tax=Kitasatospora sp. NPDC089509 TaxID=3364079 RepID=UPI0038068D0E
MSVPSVDDEVAPGVPACRGVDPELFFALGQGGGEGPRVRAAKRVCQDCPVREACLRAAVLQEEEYGIWGGLTPEERRRLHEQSRALLALGENAARVLDELLLSGGTLHGRQRPAAVLVLLARGWSERDVADALGIEYASLRAARDTARLVLWYCRVVGRRLPSWADARPEWSGAGRIGGRGSGGTLGIGRAEDADVGRSGRPA